MLYVYRTWPQDGFFGMSVPDFVQRTVYVREHGLVVDALFHQFEAAWNRGAALARQLGWEGDVRSGYPMVSLLPEEGPEVFLVIVWKQENDGTSFVISERPLSWLEEQGAWLQEE
jgi:hypothetical protein